MAASRKPTLADLAAQRADLDRAIAAATLPALNEAAEAMRDPAIATLVEKLTTLGAGLTGENATQLSNVVVVLTQVPLYLDGQAASLDRLVNPPEAA